MLWTGQITVTPDYLIDNSLAFLKEKGIEISRFELKILLAAALGIEPADLPFYTADVNEAAADKFEKMVARRAEGCPVDKIIGLRGFYKYDFIVNEDVLSPRPETEIMVEKALVLLKNTPSPHLLEFGIGSGCVLLSVLKELTNSRGIGIDVSAHALTVAAQKAEPGPAGVSSAAEPGTLCGAAITKRPRMPRRPQAAATSPMVGRRFSSTHGLMPTVPPGSR